MRALADSGQHIVLCVVTNLCEAAASFYEHICNANSKFRENSSLVSTSTAMIFLPES